MFSPRNVMIAGVVLVAVALGSSGHGIWWLFGLLWVLPHAASRPPPRVRLRRERPDGVTTAGSRTTSPSPHVAARPDAGPARGLSRPLTASVMMGA